MADIKKLLTEHMAIWTAADTEKKSGRGRASGNAGSVYGVKKLRELILELAVRGKLVPQDPNDEPASELLKRIQTEKEKSQSKSPQTTSKRKSTASATPPFAKGGMGGIGEDEKPFELPNGWEWARLQDVYDVRDGTHDTPKYAETGFPLVTSKNLYSGTLDFSDIKYISEQDHLKIKERSKVDKGDILFAMIGSIGNPVIVDTDVEFSIKNVALFKPYSAHLSNTSYLLKYLSKAAISFREEAAGAVQSFVSLGVIRNYLIPLPPLAEQHRIVAKVDELMALCDQLEQQHSNAQEAHETLVSQLLATLTRPHKTTPPFSQRGAGGDLDWQRIYAHFDVLFITEASIDALKQTLLQLAVMGKLVQQDPNDEPAGELIKNILITRNNLIKNEALKTVASEVFNQDDFYIQVPTSWTYCRLGNLAKFIDYRGKTPNKVEFGIPLITAKNVRQGYINREPEEFVTTEDYDLWMTRGFPRVGDMLFTTEAPLGNIALIHITEKFALAQRVICFQLHNQDMGRYLKIALMSKQVQRQFESEATGMTATGIKASNLKEIPIPIPPLAEQHRIVAKVDALMALCDQLKIRIQQANQQQQTIADALVAQALNLPAVEIVDLAS